MKNERPIEQQPISEQMPIAGTSAQMPQNPVLAVRCIHSHEDGLTKGKIYDAHKQGNWGYDVFPDDNGYLSGWDKRYFEVVSNNR